MVYELKYGDVLERCRMLCSYEGRDETDANGDSKYLDIRITAQDEPLLYGYMREAAEYIESLISRMVLSSEYGDGCFRLELRTEETRWNGMKNFDKYMNEAIVSHAMSKWLIGRKDSKVEFYGTLYADMSRMLVRNLFEKSAPKRKIRRKTDFSEVTVEVVNK